MPLPIIFNDHPLKNLTPIDLQLAFSHNLLIWGEGGTGKTSLACEIGRWAMTCAGKFPYRKGSLLKYPAIVILIEDDLDLTVATGVDPLLAAIKGQLEDITDESISDNFLKALLKKRHLFVIIDRLSEMSDNTRKFVNPTLPGFPVKALVVTSRFEELLGNSTRATIQTCKLNGNYLSNFLDEYMRLEHLRSSLSHQDFFNACQKLHQITLSEQNGLPVMLVKLYAAHPGQVIENTAQVILDYVKQLISNTKLSPFSNNLSDEKRTEKIIADVKICAWTCLTKNSFRPLPVKNNILVKELETVDQAQADRRLNFLKDELGILKMMGTEDDKMSFELNLLAEYLAALHVIYNDTAWSAFIQQAKSLQVDDQNLINFVKIIQECLKSEQSESNEDLETKLLELKQHVPSLIQSSDPKPTENSSGVY